MTYKKAPIVEAALDIQFEPKDWSQCGVEFADSFASVIGPRYLEKKVLKRQSVKIELGSSSASSVSNEQHSTGWRFDSTDQGRVIQIWPHGFTFSHLPPYSEWARFREEAHSAWSSFSTTFNPNPARRLGLRYINRIDIPGEKFNAEEYFQVYPRIDERLVVDVNEFFMKLRSPLDHLLDGARVLLNMALVPEAVPDHTSILLDFDVYCLLGDRADPDIWGIFDRLRDIKNELFESSITDVTRELFK